MIKLIDRQLIRSFFKGYVVCLTALLSLYIVVDLFTNMDEFGRHQQGLMETLRRIGLYYGTRVAQIFDRLFEAILLMAAMFTVALMQRNNEQLPLLSAGISTQRMVMPVLFSATILLSLMIYNQEVLIPMLGDRLTNQRDDPDGHREVGARGAYEPNGIHIVGRTAVRVPRQMVRDFCVAIPDKIIGILVHLQAAEAYYVPPDEGKKRTGGWELIRTKTIPATFDCSQTKTLEQIDKGKFFLYTKQVDFDALTRNQKWFLLASTRELYQDLQRPESERLSAKAVLFHMRFTRPILSIILIILGLSVILRDQTRNVFISTGLCLGTCALFFIANYLCKLMGDYDVIPPALAAWLPVLLFGPLAIVNFDAVHT